MPAAASPISAATASTGASLPAPPFPMSSRCPVPRAASVPGRPSRASITTRSTAPMAGSGVATGDRHKSFAGSGSQPRACSRASYYRRLPAAADDRAAWIFAGIDDEIIGDFGLSGGGAAGFELDRADPELGTPPNAIILARSEEHQRHFVVVPEELLTHVTTVNGERPKALIRAEIVYFETIGDGAVFSTGSITFCGSLSHNNYENNVSRMLENVLRRFRA